MLIMDIKQKKYTSNKTGENYRKVRKDEREVLEEPIIINDENDEEEKYRLPPISFVKIP